MAHKCFTIKNWFLTSLVYVSNSKKKIQRAIQAMSISAVSVFQLRFLNQNKSEQNEHQTKGKYHKLPMKL